MVNITGLDLSHISSEYNFANCLNECLMSLCDGKWMIQSNFKVIISKWSQISVWFLWYKFHRAYVWLVITYILVFIFQIQFGWLVWRKNSTATFTNNFNPRRTYERYSYITTFLLRNNEWYLHTKCNVVKAPIRDFPRKNGVEYGIKRLIVRSHTVSNVPDWWLESCYYFEIW